MKHPSNKVILMYCAQKHRNANSARIKKKRITKGPDNAEPSQIGIKHQVNHVEKYLELFCSSTS